MELVPHLGKGIKETAKLHGQGLGFTCSAFAVVGAILLAASRDLKGDEERKRDLGYKAREC
jgi:hypothetical protein